MSSVILPGVFAPGKQFFIGQTFRAHGNLPFHLAVWKAINDPKSTKSAVIEFIVPDTDRYNSGDRMSVLMFSTQDDLDEFNVWWSSYTNRFKEVEMENAKYPTIVEGMHVDGYAYKHNLRSDSKAGFHDWVWMVSSTTGSVTHTTDYWLFEDKAEMLQFKLLGHRDFPRGFDHQRLLSGVDTTSYADIDEM